MIVSLSVRRLRLRAALLLLVTGWFSGVAVAQKTDTAAVSITEQQAVQDSAETWLALIDNRDYASAWEQMSAALRQQVTQADWEQTMRSAHGPLSPLHSRVLQGREYTTTLPNTPKGEYIVITYRSSFVDQLEDAIETVVMVRNPASKWKPAGYYYRLVP